MPDFSDHIIDINVQTYLKIPTDQTEAVTGLSEKLYALCHTIESRSEWIVCIPRGGNLLMVIQLLSKHRVPYEIEIMKGGDFD